VTPAEHPPTADRGEPDPRLVAALQARDPERIRDALITARLLVAVVALPGAEHASEGTDDTAHSARMALALLESADGSQALPAFTGLDALTSWNGAARPVPRPATDVIAYASGEGLPIVLDPGSPHTWTLLTQPPDPVYAAPSWKPGRRLRKAARHDVHRVYAIDTPGGAGLAVICPAGTLDSPWAEQLVQHAPPGAQLMLVTPDDEADILRVGVSLD
jgi:hypothetical protein